MTPVRPGLFQTLIVMLSLVLGAASIGAQQTAPPAASKAAPSDAPTLEPKAIEILKASSRRLAAAHAR